MQKLPVRDETLRLALSRDHQSWLRSEIRDRFIAIIVLAVVLIMAGATMVYVIGDNEELPDILWVTESTTRDAIAEYETEGFEVRIHKPVSGVEAVDTPNDSSDRIPWFIGAVVLIVVAIGAPFLILRALFEIVRLRRWQRDHDAFLIAHGFDPDEVEKSVRSTVN